MKFQLIGLVCLCLCFALLVIKVQAEISPLDPEHENHAANNNQNDVVKDEQKSDENGFMGASGSFVHGFIATFSVIVVSELGDKTFFIAAIMAMRHPRWTVFIGAIAALAIMHVMSAFFGYAITVIPRTFTYYISSLLFAIFGLKMLREGWKMSPNVSRLLSRH